MTADRSKVGKSKLSGVYDASVSKSVREHFSFSDALWIVILIVALIVLAVLIVKYQVISPEEYAAVKQKYNASISAVVSQLDSTTIVTPQVSVPLSFDSEFFSSNSKFISNFATMAAGC